MKTVALDIPKKMFQIAALPETQEKPYDLCLACPFIGETCDGPDCLAMESERWIEWANSRAKLLRMTRQDIAEKSGLPIGTVNNVLTGRTKDTRHSTMQAITKVLIGGCWGQYPCHIAALLLTGALNEQSRDEAEVATVREEAQRKIDFLKNEIELRNKQIEKLNEQASVDRGTIKRKDWVIGILVGVSMLLMLALIAYLLYDKSQPDFGIFRATAMLWR